MFLTPDMKLPQACYDRWALARARPDLTPEHLRYLIRNMDRYFPGVWEAEQEANRLALEAEEKLDKEERERIGLQQTVPFGNKGHSMPLFPVKRRAQLGLIAHQLVAVQPMSSPSAALFYLGLDYVSLEATRWINWLAAKDPITPRLTWHSSQVQPVREECSLPREVSPLLQQEVFSCFERIMAKSEQTMTYDPAAFTWLQTRYALKSIHRLFDSVGADTISVGDMRGMDDLPFLNRVSLWLAKRVVELNPDPQKVAVDMAEQVTFHGENLADFWLLEALLEAADPQTPPARLQEFVRGNWSLASLALQNPNINKDDWAGYVFINPNAALQNPQLAIWLLEDPRFFAGLDKGSLMALGTSDKWGAELFNSLMGSVLSGDLNRVLTGGEYDLLLECPCITEEQTKIVTEAKGKFLAGRESVDVL